MKKVLVAIINYNNRDRLISTLKALFSQSDIQLVDVALYDNGSDDISIEHLKLMFPKLNIIINNNEKNPYVSRNIALKDAKNYESLVLLDSNCVPQENFLNEGLKILDSADIGSGPIYYDYKNYYSYFELVDIVTFTPQAISYRIGVSYPSGFLFLKSSIISDVGCFLTHRSASDELWTKKATTLGYKLGYNEKCQVYTLPKSGLVFIKRHFRTGRYLCLSSLSISSYFKLILPPNPSLISRLQLFKIEIPFYRYPLVYLNLYLYKLILWAGASVSIISKPK